MADGNISAGSKDAVNGGQLYTAQTNLQNSINKTNEAVQKNADNIATNASNIASNKADIATNKANIATNASNIAGLRTDVDHHSEQISGLQNDVKNINTNISNIKDNILTVEGNVAKNASDIRNLQAADGYSVKYSSSAKNEIKLEGTDGTKLTNVANATTDDGAVNLGQMNSAINAEKTAREDADKALSDRIGTVTESSNYNAIKSSNTVSKNLEALDSALDSVVSGNTGLTIDNGDEITIAKNSTSNTVSFLGNNGSTRVLTGIQTDINDGTSAATVDFVNQKSHSDRKYADGIGAQTAAMSSLHPVAVDGSKISVAASLGAYKSDVAGAIGAFYKPDKQSMISVQGAFGYNNNMIGVGVAKALGEVTTLSEKDSKEVEKLRQQMDSMEERHASEMAEVKEQNEKLAKQNEAIIKLLSEKSGLSLNTVSAMIEQE